MKELKFEDLTIEQKLGMVSVATIGTRQNAEYEEYILDLIRNHSLGCLWVQMGGCDDDMAGFVKKAKDLADYPLIIVQDAESGIGDFMIGSHSALGIAGTQEQAYAFGKCVGVTARNLGYNMLCDPVVDMKLGSARSLGSDKEKVAELAVAMARGLRDAGILTLAKHYPGGSDAKGIDSHMTEGISEDTVEDLLNYDLYPYKRLMEENLLDGIMTQHKRFINIDPDYPGTLSKNVLGIIRNLGFDGVIMTDSLGMMGIRAKYGFVASKGLAINAGIDLLLHYAQNNKPEFDAVRESYDTGGVDEKVLDEAVKRVLATQKKTMIEPKFTELTKEDIEMFESINKDSIYTKTDEGVSVSIPRDGKHLFVVLVRSGAKLNEGGKMMVDTFTNDWHQPMNLEKKIKELFPNSEVSMIEQFPGPMQCARVLRDAIEYDDVVFISFSEQMAYTGPEHITRRIENVITAMQHTGQISTIMHFGNPLVLGNIEHSSRYIIGAQSKCCELAAIEVLAGLYTPKGKPIFDANLK
ncbi:MAG: hypothetical protein J6A69_00585 [Clostridia bacterium]|nr:hypothetical protein [Clostridia bacterium]